MATLKLFHEGGVFCELSGYSIVENLLFDVTAQTPNAELNPFEKLYVVHAVGVPVHRGYLADVHMQCGCFAEARTHYLSPEHPRKLGDISWCEGRLEEAEEYYSKAKSEAQPYRTDPDHDRLIKLAFFREAWDLVLHRFCAASFGRGFLDGQVSIGRSHTAAMPYLEMLACAVVRSGEPLPHLARGHLERAFRLSAEQWQELLARVREAEAKTIVKLRKRCRPKLGAATPSTADAARHIGDTARARFVARYIRDADESLETAQSLLEKFAASGAEVDLQSFLERVVGSGVESVSRSFLFAAFGHDSFPKSPISPTKLIRLLSAHPIMNRRHLGSLLDLRFRLNSPITGDELLAGVFQNFAAQSPFTPNEEQPLASVDELGSVREWARVRLEEWLVGRGEAKADAMAEQWRVGAVTPKAGDFLRPRRTQMDSPRDSKQWAELTEAAAQWLRGRWRREIGATPWVSENQLFQIMRRQLKGLDVFQHARPTWLEPQHLDVYVPAVDLAVEFMGRQHFEPLDFFGGESAHRELVERDRRKAELCRAHGLELLYVRHDEDLALRAKELVAHALTKAKTRRLVS